MTTLNELKQSLARLARLYVENAKLSAIEGLTLFFGGFAITALLFVCVIIFLMFVSFGVAQELCNILSPALAYFIVALFWLLIMVLVYLLRNFIVYNPAVKFISKLIYKETAKQSEDNSDEKSK